MTDLRERVDAPPVPGHSIRRGWLGVGTLAVGTFTVVTSEMLPVGLLTPMRHDLNISEGTAGLAMTETGLVAAISAPLLTAALSRFDRRWVMTGLMAVLILGNVTAAAAPNFGVLTVGRVLVGLGMGGVWSLAAGLAARLVPENRTATAVSVVFSGIAIASVLGIPAGAYLGAVAGWRAAFLVTAGLAVVLLVAMPAVLPPLRAQGDVALRGVFGLAGNPALRTGLLIVAFLVAGHFAAYTYVRPVLEDVTGADAGLIGSLLLVYGIAGIAGNFVAGPRASRRPRATLLAISGVLGVAVLLLPMLGGTALIAGVFIVIWGIAYGGVSVSTLTWAMLSEPGARDGAASLLTAVFNFAIAAGALLGGLAANGLGSSAAMWLGGALAIAAVLTTAFGTAPARN
ncbi:MFS transporter [Nocardia arthritidis]|uniref:MFS transporter n=1 Tax=Nocardia arthritidis TaxID=228602 RepID=A0A6G9YND9_9NOCA|nr:MFS transporter [Nocardia arthritidis]QIS14701.1 MFS transporter [Nocardia arthritidis]